MSSHTITVTNDTFEQVVLRSDKPVVVDFFSEWCGPCKDMAPKLDQLAVEYQGRLLVAKINADNCRKLVEKYQVRGYPTLLYFIRGKVIKRTIGRVCHDRLKAECDTLLLHARGIVSAAPHIAYDSAICQAEAKKDERSNAAMQACLVTNQTIPEVQTIEELHRPIREAAEAELKEQRALLKAGEMTEDQYFELYTKTFRRVSQEPRFAEAMEKIKAGIPAMMDAVSGATGAMLAEIDAAETKCAATILAANKELSQPSQN